MKRYLPVATAFVFLASQGCPQPADLSAEDTTASDEVETGAGDMTADAGLPEAGEPTTCLIVASRDWRAWINAMPGPDAVRTLIVEGVVDTPTPGYTFEWEAGMADRSAIPMQRLHLTATPPDGMAAQVITTETVRYEGPAIAENYRAVAVMCGEVLLADITDVVTAQ